MPYSLRGFWIRKWKREGYASRKLEIVVSDIGANPKGKGRLVTLPEGSNIPRKFDVYHTRYIGRVDQVTLRDRDSRQTYIVNTRRRVLEAFPSRGPGEQIQFERLHHTHFMFL